MDFAHDSGMLAVRLGIGLIFAAHGVQKLFGWFGGHGIKGTGQFFENFGFRPGALFATLAGIGEAGGGLLIALGFLGPAGAMLAGSTMLVAAVSVHLAKGFWASNGGYEMTLGYGLAAFAIAFAGPGSFSLDYVFGLQSLDSSLFAWIGVALAIIGAFGTLVVRRPQPQAVAKP
jgi:putative oxidoreductase